MASQEFQKLLISLFPKMRSWALSMTRNSTAADDLVQEVAVKALRASHTFDMGTNFPAWIYRILTNQFLSNMRAMREFNELDQVPETAIPASQQDATDLRELSHEFGRLPSEQREAITMIVLEECGYDEVSAKTGHPIGTLKSRVNRGRATLRAFMLEEQPVAHARA